MSRVTDLKVVSVATADSGAATATFQQCFGLPVTRTSDDPASLTTSTFLAIGSAEIAMEAPTDAASPVAAFLTERGSGLYELVLEVDDLERTRTELAAKGIEVARARTADGRAAGSIDPAVTHGVRITLLGR